MATLKFTYFLTSRNILLKIRLCVYVLWLLEYLIKKPPVPTKRATSLIEVKSCNALLRMLLVCISGYMKSVLKHQFLILGTYDVNF